MGIAATARKSTIGVAGDGMRGRFHRTSAGSPNVQYEIICLVAGERRALRVVAANAAAAVASAQLLEPDQFELLAVVRGVDGPPTLAASGIE